MCQRFNRYYVAHYMYGRMLHLCYCGPFFISEVWQLYQIFTTMEQIRPSPSLILLHSFEAWKAHSIQFGSVQSPISSIKMLNLIPKHTQTLNTTDQHSLLLIKSCSSFLLIFGGMGFSTIICSKQKEWDGLGILYLSLKPYIKAQQLLSNCSTRPSAPSHSEPSKTQIHCFGQDLTRNIESHEFKRQRHLILLPAQPLIINSSY